MLATIHVIDFEGNRTHGILEYGLVTLKNLSITDISMASCCKSLSHQMANFAEHSRFSSNEKDKNFEHYLPLFMKKRAEGLFCAHGASVEDRLLRQYCLTPGVVGSLPEQYNPKSTQKISVQKSISTQSQTSTPTAMASLKSVSWGPWIDTYKIYRNYYPAAECYEVAELIRHFGLEKKLKNLATKHNLAKTLTFHRAPYDASATALLLRNFINHFQIKDVCFLLNH
jgi:DNA polymerase III epsilon subunit-like protein